MSVQDSEIHLNLENLLDKPIQEEICESSPSSEKSSHKNIESYRIKTPPALETKSSAADNQAETIGEYHDTVSSLSNVNCCTNLNPMFNAVAEAHENRKGSVFSESSYKTADTAEQKTFSKLNSRAHSKDSLIQEEEKQTHTSKEKIVPTSYEEQEIIEVAVAPQEDHQQLPGLVTSLQSIVSNSLMKRELKVERYNSLQQQSISLMNTKLFLNELDPESSPDVSEDDINQPATLRNPKSQRLEDGRQPRGDSALKQMIDLKKKLAKGFGEST